MDTNNDIRLRLRFYKEVDQNIDSLLQKFNYFTTKNSPDFILKIKGYHIWIDIKSSKKEYWSPHLHLEMESRGKNQSHIRGLFGPDPNLWTFFMFLHFMIAGTFIIFCGIAYTHYVLKTPV
ncbi:GTP-binding protein [Flavobacterium sp. AC]|uniref:GTP-binding protein n=1 Tax=Flavobacterium azizsancarii TaxID=2961580 RepID=A0ABT4W9C6_9FLAO|nr:GTP-binding protein [Flavobacterium azizsancarii]MDA6069133.1 GTP-binding protein [Flavobacterium azizsancarii]